MDKLIYLGDSQYVMASQISRIYLDENYKIRIKLIDGSCLNVSCSLKGGQYQRLEQLVSEINQVLCKSNH